VSKQVIASYFLFYSKMCFTKNCRVALAQIHVLIDDIWTMKLLIYFIEKVYLILIGIHICAYSGQVSFSDFYFYLFIFLVRV
jgi:hypothetical protein